MTAEIIDLAQVRRARQPARFHLGHVIEATALMWIVASLVFADWMFGAAFKSPEPIDAPSPGLTSGQCAGAPATDGITYLCSSSRFAEDKPRD